MKNEKQTKKQKHAAKPWGFQFRGGIKGIDFSEIAETLSRKNPVAVVTLIPNEKGAAKNIAVVIHHSLMVKCQWVHGVGIAVHLSQACIVDSIVEYDNFAYAVLEGRNAVDAVAGIVCALERVKNHNLPDKREYTAAVNYPKV